MSTQPDDDDVIALSETVRVTKSITMSFPWGRQHHTQYVKVEVEERRLPDETEEAFNERTSLYCLRELYALANEHVTIINEWSKE